jgi:hypothetical protein
MTIACSPALLMSTLEVMDRAERRIDVFERNEN